MQRVTGVGGLFFKARDPDALKRWYTETLGLESAPAWMAEGGPIVFAPFPETDDYFGRAEQRFMLNFRVDDLDAMIAQCEARGVAVETREEWDGAVGRFARVYDPEGNPVELWEPSALVRAETP